MSGNARRIGALEQNGRLSTEELQKGEGRIAEIRRHCESLERSLEREREERIRAEKQASVLEGERNGLLVQLADLRGRLETMPLRGARAGKRPRLLLMTPGDSRLENGSGG